MKSRDQETALMAETAPSEIEFAAGMTQLAFNLKEPWLPAGFDYLKLAEDERRVYNALYFHQGHAKAVKVRELAFEAFPFRPAADRERVTRDLVKALTEDHKIAIATSVHKPYGVYFVTSPDELLDYCNSLTARIVSTARRIASLKKISLPAFLGQLSVELSEIKNG